MFDDAEEPKFWEPYSHKIGDIVRINVGGECYIPIEHIVEGEKVADKQGHDRIYHLELGMVVDKVDKGDGHTYRVALLKHKEYRGVLSIGADFAAIELDPVSDVTLTKDMKMCVYIFMHVSRTTPFDIG